MAVSPSDKIVRGGDLTMIGSLIKTELGGKQDNITAVEVNVDSNTGTPSASASITGGTLTMNFSNLKGSQGLQGNTGSSVDYPYELVNNLETDDTTKGLSAAMGKRLGDDVAYLMAGFQKLAPWAFKDTPNMSNPVYRDIAFFPVSAGVATLRYGYTSSLAKYLMSPVFDLGEIGDSYNLTFSVGEVASNNATYPGIIYLDEDMLPYTYHLANSNPRTVSGTVAETMKYVRLLFKTENILDSYIYDNVEGEYLFRGSQLDLATIEDKEAILTSDYWIDWGPNSNGDWIGWNFATSDTAATNQRSNIDYPLFKLVGQNAEDFSYSVSKIVELPVGETELELEFSCGEVDSGLMLRLLNPSAGTANYFAANANPRTETVNTNTYTHAQLYFKTANYASCYIKDATNNVMLWQGLSSN